MLCEECQKKEATGQHHMVYRSQCRTMINMDINKKWLCDKCHVGDKGPHRDRKKDLLYKLEVQKKLEKILCRQYYTAAGLKKALKLTDNQLKQTIKTLKLHKDGYAAVDIIRYLMGGRLYYVEVA